MTYLICLLLYCYITDVDENVDVLRNISCINIQYLNFSDMFSSPTWASLKEIKNPVLKSLANKLPAIAIRHRQHSTIKVYNAGYNR